MPPVPIQQATTIRKCKAAFAFALQGGRIYKNRTCCLRSGFYFGVDFRVIANRVKRAFKVLRQGMALE